MASCPKCGNYRIHAHRCRRCGPVGSLPVPVPVPFSEPAK